MTLTLSGRPYLDEIILRYYPSSEAAYTAYEDGIVEGIGDVDSSILSAVLAQPDLSIYTAREPILTMTYLKPRQQRGWILAECRFPAGTDGSDQS